MIRKIIEINEELCNGCGDCVPNCAEGALRIIDGKARMISDLFCDGLGACIGHCPTGAIEIVEREAEPYDEWRVMEKIVEGGPNVIIAHLQHLDSHGERGYLSEARRYLKTYGIDEPDIEAGEEKGKREAEPSLTTATKSAGGFSGCAGSLTARLAGKTMSREDRGAEYSELRHWPIQLHLVNPAAPYYRDADLLVAADCTAFAAGNFHSAYLKGRAAAIACPKLDDGGERYIEKLAVMLEAAKSVTVLLMEVPCCGGLLNMVKEARSRISKPIAVKCVVLNLQGEKIEEKSV